MSILKKSFGFVNGEEIFSYTLGSDRFYVTVIPYGARITKAVFCGTSVICGFDNMEGYLKDGDYHGSTVGRYANRISDGKFTLGGKEYTLACNEVSRGEHLHGGNVGFSSRIWKVEETVSTNGWDSVKMSFFSPDGEEGYPGNLMVYVTFTVQNQSLIIDYKAHSDADTILNLTNHSYFSLSGVGNTVRDHLLTLNCDHYIPVNDRLIPVGKIESVIATPFDFRGTKEIGQDIEANDPQIRIAGGYDHCFVRRNGENLKEPGWIATISSPVSHITMDVLTTEGGIQMYTGNFMTAPNPFFGTIEQRANEAVALECNRMPDSPNQTAFPSPVLRAGEEYLQTTVYSFRK